MARERALVGGAEQRMREVQARLDNVARVRLYAWKGGITCEGMLHCKPGCTASCSRQTHCSHSGCAADRTSAALTRILQRILSANVHRSASVTSNRMSHTAPAAVWNMDTVVGSKHVQPHYFCQQPRHAPAYPTLPQPDQTQVSLTSPHLSSAHLQCRTTTSPSYLDPRAQVQKEVQKAMRLLGEVDTELGHKKQASASVKQLQGQLTGVQQEGEAVEAHLRSLRAKSERLTLWTSQHEHQVRRCMPPGLMVLSGAPEKQQLRGALRHWGSGHALGHLRDSSQSMLSQLAELQPSSMSFRCNGLPLHDRIYCRSGTYQKEGTCMDTMCCCSSGALQAPSLRPHICWLTQLLQLMHWCRAACGRRQLCPRWKSSAGAGMQWRPPMLPTWPSWLRMMPW